MSPPDQTSTDQPELLPGLVRETVARSRKAAATKARKAAEAPLAELDPVARVLVDLPLAHTSTGRSTTPSPPRWPPTRCRVCG